MWALVSVVHLEKSELWHAICFKNKGDFIAGRMPPFFSQLTISLTVNSISLAVNSRLIQFLSRFDFSRGRGDSGSNIFNNSRTLEPLPPISK